MLVKLLTHERGSAFSTFAALPTHAFFCTVAVLRRLLNLPIREARKTSLLSKRHKLATHWLITLDTSRHCHILIVQSAKVHALVAKMALVSERRATRWLVAKEARTVDANVFF